MGGLGCRPGSGAAHGTGMPLARALDLAMACVLLVGRQQQAGACDAGVFFGENCTQALAAVWRGR